MDNNRFKGTGVAIVTPFHNDGSIDFNGLGRLVNHLIISGADYLVVLGTTGETVTLNKDEKQAVVNYVVEITEKRVPIVLGLGGNNTREVISDFKFFDFENIDAVLSVSPYYNKPIQEGIFQHYRMIAGECPVPLILYNVPGRTASNLSAETTLRLAQVSNIIGVKEASGNLEQCMKIIKDRPEGFLVISGDDALTLPLIACGGDGVISVVANAYPAIFSQMVNFALKGDFENARKNHYKLLDITNLFFAEGNPGGVKAALKIMDIMQDNLRLPLVNISDITFEKIRKEIESIELVAK
jgi:4-hydroxy-tetrahydrodipicolinate synthase